MRLSAGKTSVHAGGKGGHGRLAQRILLALLLVTFILPSFAAIHASGDDAEILAPGFYKDRIVLCTGAGLKIIKLDPATGKPLDDQSDTEDHLSPVCAPMVTASLFLSPSLPVAEAIFGGGEPLDLRDEVAILHEQAASPPLPPRGPPAG
ncbi:hypothetical protein FHS78_002315 [Parvibaculum indicum]|uniref:hypothetical protein n=1 Tax=Parvibaculum indicum TaxID=562969 RepID=UPI001421929E|nr:hypothetical protein [Parvibaculum indicum]NIJ42024.1 hypothetical protein [Parvibaculum indicum]